MTRGEDAAGARPGKALVEAGFCGDGGGEGHVCRGPEATSEMTDVPTHEDEGNGSGASQSANMTYRVLPVFSLAFMQNEVGKWRLWMLDLRQVRQEYRSCHRRKSRKLGNDQS
jgi:hypothetical protein